MQHFSRCERAQRKFETSPIGSLRPNAPAAMPTSEAFGQLPLGKLLVFHRQRGAVVWEWREEWRANYAKSPTSRSHSETPSLE
jgi:hypothetical protein